MRLCHSRFGRFGEPFGAQLRVGGAALAAQQHHRQVVLCKSVAAARRCAEAGACLSVVTVRVRVQRALRGGRRGSRRQPKQHAECGAHGHASSHQPVPGYNPSKSSIVTAPFEGRDAATRPHGARRCSSAHSIYSRSASVRRARTRSDRCAPRCVSRRASRTDGSLPRTARVVVDLYGSLALTGRGHCTDRAVMLGLSGEAPDRIDPDQVEPKIERIRAQQMLSLAGTHPIAFREAEHLRFRIDKALPFHSNGDPLHRFRCRRRAACAQDLLFGRRRLRRRRTGSRAAGRPGPTLRVPYPFTSAARTAARMAPKRTSAFRR